MILTGEQLNEFFGFDLASNAFFSCGTSIMIDGLAWELTEIIGDNYCFFPSKNIKDAISNLEFFAENN